MPSRLSIPALALGLALVTAACGSGSATAPAGSPSAVVPAGSAPTAGSISPTASSAVPAASAPASSAAPAPAAAAALDCTAPANPTVAQTDGPYYRTGAPEGGDLATDGMPGTRLTLTGYVVDTTCTPIADARVETWQADASGAYDNAGFTLRGWVTTDATGRFTIHTVVPGEYPGRAEHIHVKVTPPGGSTLTSQLYFPGSAANGEDGIYDPSLDLAITQAGDALVGTYTFVVGG